MLLLLEEKKDSTSREMGNIRRLYEVELADVRKSLDKLANERDRLQLDYGSLKEEHRKLQELQDVRHRHESRIMEVESGRRREFDSKLADSMQRLRQDHDVQMSWELLDEQTGLRSLAVYMIHGALIEALH
ncbi:hypothetical protein NHX12_005592 [Muraenolepis orangiensis]|uniref:Uncharacterized protein n=1 Tax=Muraenolepis orangiensis TaxID=630683 RepID=A0A9Q0DRW0_9TELE|nr:hypothetical protein NHX12_005592 [Muraenolepis orangiensis]